MSMVIRFEPGDFYTIAKKSIEILNDVEKFKKFSRNSIEIARGHDIYECAKKLESLYHQVIENFGKSRDLIISAFREN
jgi:1,2-diacylglycerol 3-alpha-glucosyltransferase